jgi:hypothetical protein
VERRDELIRQARGAQRVRDLLVDDERVEQARELERCPGVVRALGDDQRESPVSTLREELGGDERADHGRVEQADSLEADHHVRVQAQLVEQDEAHLPLGGEIVIAREPDHRRRSGHCHDRSGAGHPRSYPSVRFRTHAREKRAKSTLLRP